MRIYEIYNSGIRVFKVVNNHETGCLNKKLAKF
jgi:hypothetical protein